MKSVSIVIPCYNEAERLDTSAFESFCAAHEDIAFIFVNDGSTDGTGALLDAMRERNPRRIRAVHMDRNQGKAEAVRRGMLAGLESDAKFVGFWDADLATPLEDIPDFVALFEGRPDLEAVFGSRVNLLGRSVQRRLVRHYIGRIFATCAAAALRVPIYDTQCGAKMFRNCDQTRELFETPFISKWIFDVEIIARMVANGRRVNAAPIASRLNEHPLMRWDDVAGSKIRPQDFLVVASDLIRIKLRYS